MPQSVEGAVTITDPASGCPINLVCELLGDRWTLVVLRDLVFTERSGFGRNSASWYGRRGSATLTACRPPECQVLNATCGVSVGLCAEYEVRGGFHVAQVDGSFSGSR